MKIYTRKGDMGTTSLVGGTRITKSDQRIEAYGTVDELSSHVGYLRDMLPEGDRNSEILLRILDRLMICEALLASEDAMIPKLPQLDAQDVEFLEQQTDILMEDLPALQNFTLPTGHPLMSYCHVCRTVCRRAEREIVRLGVEDRPVVGQYINRLSDYLYALGRNMAHTHHAQEFSWKP